MLKARLFAAIALLCFCTSVWAGGSTVNPTVPVFGAAMSSAPIRSNFAAAYSDINGLIGQNNSATAPASPVLGQLWLNTSAAPYVLNEWDGSAWVQQGALNPSTHLWSFAPNSTISWASISGTPTTLAGYGITNGVSSVGLMLPSIFTCGGSPVTSSGTFSCVLNSQSPNLFLASPSGSTGAPTFRAIQPSDVPTLNQNTTGNAATATLATTATTATTAGNVTGTVAIANGGTGAATASAALTNLGAASSGANSNITSLTGLTTAISIPQGGTGATTKAAAFNALSPMTATGDLEYESATGVASRLPIGSNGQVFTVVSGVPTWSSASSGLTVVPGYINGYTLSNDATTPNSVLDIAAGTAADSTNAAMIVGTAFTKSTAGLWAAGSGANGMGAGLTVTANTWYHVFAIINNGAFDVYFDTSPTAANKPSGTTAFRYVGSIKTNTSSQIIAFTQTGQQFRWATNIADLTTSGATATTETAVLVSTPVGFVTYPILLVAIQLGSSSSYLTIYPGTSTQADAVVLGTSTNVNTEYQIRTTTNTSSLISYKSSYATDYDTIYTLGYINPHVAQNF